MSSNVTKKLMALNAVSSVSRFLSSLAPYSTDPKRTNAWGDYGYKLQLTFDDYFSMYKRNGIGRAMCIRHVEKTWQTYPNILQYEDPHDPTPWEQQFTEFAKRTRLFKMLSGLDERNRVGKYAGLIFIFADGKRPSEPVERVPGTWNGLYKVIPAFESQLQPNSWDTDPTSPTYGEPVTFTYNEGAVGDHSRKDPSRVVTVHRSRVHIWAEGADDGSIYGTPALEAGFNALQTLEKIVGAGGEGFWKSARAALTMDIDKDANLAQLATMLGTDVDGIADKMEDLVEDFYSGGDKSLLTQGFKTNPLNISLPSPEHFFAIALNEAAASVSTPKRILLGNQSGERASTEDRDEWNTTIASRRSRFVVPEIERIIQYLMDVAVIPERKFVIDWDDLTAPDMKTKLENVKVMSEANRNSMGTGEPPPFTSDEIREVAGYLPEDDDDDLDDIPEGQGDEEETEDD